jgi:hypothetical protein
MLTELSFCEAAPATEADGTTGVLSILKVFVCPLLNVATLLTVCGAAGKLVAASTDCNVPSTILPALTTSNEAVMGNGMADDMGYLLMTGQAGKFVGKLLRLECGNEANIR